MNLPSSCPLVTTWQEISRKTIDELEKLQLNFLRALLGVGSSCPKVMIYSETGMVLMELRILQKKLLWQVRSSPFKLKIVCQVFLMTAEILTNSKVGSSHPDMEFSLETQFPTIHPPTLGGFKKTLMSKIN